MKHLRIIVAVLFLAGSLSALPAFAGKYNPQLHKAQTRLLELGYHPGPADGRMGKRTRHAIKQFQHDRGLLATGVLDERTRHTIENRLKPHNGKKNRKALKIKAHTEIRKGKMDWPEVKQEKKDKRR